jgi:NAD(P)-dependent dehydrogenase (short-subunit alcohol dehydrogenase family)
MKRNDLLNNIPDQNGKNVIVTGTGGIGFEIARAMAGANANVIIAGRNEQSGAKAVLDIRTDFPEASVSFELLDLADAESIADFCARIKERLTRLDALMCIAGLMMPDDLIKTANGVEMQFQTNYLGHFALTAGLFPLLKKSPDARVVTISSIANRPARFDLSDATATRGYSASVSYALSKLCCLMFAMELAKRSEEHGWGVSAFGVHPGLAKTQLFNRSHGFTMTLLQVIFTILPFIRQSAKNASRPAMFAATSPEAVSGKYYGPWFLGVMGPPRRALIPLRAKNRELRKKLWDLSVSLTGLDID